MHIVSESCLDIIRYTQGYAYFIFNGTPEDGMATVDLYDHIGFKIKTLFNKPTTANEAQTLTIHRENLVSGMYNIVITTGSGLRTSKQLIFN